MKTRAMLIPVVGLALALGACRGDRSDKPPRQFLPDMDEQQKWSPQSESEFFADMRTMRQPPMNTVAFGPIAEVTGDAWASGYMQDRADLLAADPRVHTGKNPDGSFVDRIPIEVTPELLERGRDRFGIYCVVCHGELGNGEGSVGLKWSTLPPTWHDDKYRPGGELGQDGLLFDRAMNGVYDVTGAQKMPGYAHALSTRDGWAVVSYIRALQLARSAPLSDVPESERAVLTNQLSSATGGQP